MKLILTEKQTKILTEELLKEQETLSKLASLVNFFKDKNNTLQQQSTDVDTSKIDMSNVDVNDFTGIVKLVVDNLEGGYYNPSLHYTKAMGKSGETMFGMDRRWGTDFVNTQAGQQFWSLIDSDRQTNPDWNKWNYNGGTLRPQLIQLVAKMILPFFQKFSKKYLTPQAQNIVNNSKALTFHFAYATWNGSGFFKKFAKKINDKVSSGNTNENDLIAAATESRRNSAVSNTSNKINSIMNNLA